jgi:hypothetical protein
MQLENLAAKYEVTVDYLMDEFVIDCDVHFPDLFAVQSDDEVFLFNFS